MDQQVKNQLRDDLKVLRIDRERGRRPGRRLTSRPVVLLAVAVVAAAAVVAVLWGLRSRVKFGTTTVQVATATRRAAAGGPQPILSAGGYVIARNRVEVGSKLTGRIVSLEVKEGDFVQRGQVAARLEDSEARAVVSKAQADVETARADLAELVAGSRPQEVSRVGFDVERLDAELKSAEAKMRRSEVLARDGVISRQEFEDERLRYQTAQAARRAAQETLSLARAGPRREEIESARAKLRSAEGGLAQAQAALESTIVRVPMTGTVLDRYVSVGEMVTTGFTSELGAKQALLTVADLTDLQAELSISESDIAKVKTDLPVTITPNAYPERLYEGRVEYIAAAASRQKATVEVKVKVLNPDSFLRPDMGVKVTFYQGEGPTPRQAPRVLIPKVAVVRQEGRDYVFVVREGKAVRQAITLGTEEGDYVVVLGGLDGGEQVVVGGAVKDGEEVKAQT